MAEGSHIRTRIALCLLLLIVVAGLESWTDMDMAVQRLLYADGWPVTRAMHEGWPGLWCYRGPKIALIGFGGLCLLGVAASLARPAYRHWLRPCLFMALSLALIPLVVSGSKQLTNIYCPRELTVFGGERTYQRIFASAAPENAHAPHGKGFPAGHASGGFALMGLYFVGKSAWQRRAGLAAGLTAGWGMGLYQHLRGEHFLSHTLFSMILAWLLLCLLQRAVLQPPGTARDCPYATRYESRQYAFFAADNPAEVHCFLPGMRDVPHRHYTHCSLKLKG